MMRTFFGNQLQLAMAAGLIAVAATAVAEDSLKTVFTAEEYRRAGLGKLNPEQQAALLQALQQRGLAGPQLRPTAPAPVSAGPAEKMSRVTPVPDLGAEQLPAKKLRDADENAEVDARMTEPFRGLQGGTVFHLDNGQVWQQRIPEVYYIGKSIPNPKVMIRHTRFGYRLLIPEVEPDFAVAVKRIE